MNWLKRNGAFTAVLLVTLAYFAAIGIRLTPDAIGAFVNKETDFNSIGDFLAGMFAPIAFVWLAVAVWVQRQELNESRVQFKTSQDVIQQQMDNALEQAKFLAQQQSMAAASSKREYSLSLFPQRFEIFKSFDQICREIEDDRVQRHHPDLLTVIAQQSLFLFSHQVRHYVMDIASLELEILNIADALNSNIDHQGKFSPRTGMLRTQFEEYVAKKEKLETKLRGLVSFASRMNMFSRFLTVTDYVEPKRDSAT